MLFAVIWPFTRHETFGGKMLGLLISYMITFLKQGGNGVECSWEVL